MRATAALVSMAAVLAGCGSSSSSSGTRDAHLAIDASTPACPMNQACALPIPSGWSGYRALYDDPAVTPPECIAPLTMATSPGMDGLYAAPASCSACSCGAPSAGACAPSVETATIDPVSWTSVVVACDVTQGQACVGMAGVCADPVPDPFWSNGHCIYQAGIAACPSEFYRQHVLYASNVDTRDCTACTCSAPAMGACAAAGGQPVGTAVGAMPVTYCCDPEFMD
jgi:hypothetical protein